MLHSSSEMAEEAGTDRLSTTSSKRKGGCWKYFDKVMGSEQSELNEEVPQNMMLVSRLL